MLQYAQGRTEQADKVMRALAAAAQAALAVNAATTATVAEALTAAEKGAAGLSPAHSINADLNLPRQVPVPIERNLQMRLHGVVLAGNGNCRQHACGTRPCMHG